MSIDAINEQIRLAREAASTAPALAPAGLPATQAVGGAPVAVAQGRPVSLGELLAEGGMRVDAWLKVKDSGFYIGDDTSTLVEEIAVEFKLSDIVPFWGLRYGASPAKYFRSFDRQTESRSKKSWAQCLTEAQAADPRCRGDYASADIPATVVSTILAAKGDKKGQPLITAGQRLGITFSITNFKDFAVFIKPYSDLVTMGRMPHDTNLRGKIVHGQRKKGQDMWGAVEFDGFFAAEPFSANDNSGVAGKDAA